MQLSLGLVSPRSHRYQYVSVQINETQNSKTALDRYKLSYFVAYAIKYKLKFMFSFWIVPVQNPFPLHIDLDRGYKIFGLSALSLVSRTHSELRDPTTPIVSFASKLKNQLR